jgi:endonuclease/exonuclease/phosphatase family metal-dependent hydrolase
MNMRILTFNCWHGLDGAGIWRMGELESREHHRHRLQRQLTDLAQSQNDLLFLQEVNPIQARAFEIGRYLKFNFVEQGDLSGVKIFGWGPPLNLNSGLCLLARPTWQLQKVRGLQLSGPPWGVSFRHLALQTSECRFALLASLVHPQLGRLLVVNTHLHHGIETHPELCHDIEELARTGQITSGERDTVLKQMEHARERRLSEIQRLLAAIADRRANFAGVIIAGDFNSDETSPTIQSMKASGFVDVLAGRPQALTWNPQRNVANFRLSQTFQLPLSDFGKPPLRQVIYDHMYRPRRLDYIFVDAALAGLMKQVNLFGDQGPPEQMTSDHFGLQVELGSH